MKLYALVALAATCLTVPAFGQSTSPILYPAPPVSGLAPSSSNTTAISGSTSRSSSASQAGAVAIGGGNATGGNATGGNARSSANGNVGNVINISPAPTSTTATVRQEGKTSVSTVPNAYSPGLAAAGIETCLGSVSGGGSWLGTGISFGGTIPDPDCTTRLDARTLWSMGVATKGPRGTQLRVAALRRLCQNDRIAASMYEICGDYQIQPVAPAPQDWRRTWMTTTAKVEPILLIDGNTGKERLCNQYDEPAQKCVTWAYATPEEYKPRKKKGSSKPVPTPLPKVITEGPAGPPL